MRVAILLLLLGACDPSDAIHVRFPVSAAGPVRVYWVKPYAGQHHAGMTGAPLPVVGGQLDHTFTECCGTAVAYRRGELGFMACVDQPSGGPELVCGLLGAAAAPPVRAIATQASCADVEAALADSAIDLARCGLDPLVR